MDTQSHTVTSVKTFGEVSQRFMIELMATNPPHTGLQLLYWDGKTAKIGSTFSVKSHSSPDSGLYSICNETIFEPPELEATLLQAIRFPTDVADYDSDGRLLMDLIGLIGLYSDLSEKLCYLLAYYVLSNWVADSHPSPICVSIIGPESRQGWQLSRLLSCLVRRPLLLSDVNLAALCSLPVGLSPTLFLEQPELSRQAAKAMFLPNVRDTFLPWKGRLVNLCFAKVVRTEEPLGPAALGPLAIEIPVDPSCNGFPTLEPWLQEKLRKDYQPKLLMYRLRKRRQVGVCRVDFSNFGSRVSELGYQLASCQLGKEGLKEEMIWMLEDLNEQVQAEEETNLNALVLEALLSLSQSCQLNHTRR